MYATLESKVNHSNRHHVNREGRGREPKIRTNGIFLVVQGRMCSMGWFVFKSGRQTKCEPKLIKRGASLSP